MNNRASTKLWCNGRVCSKCGKCGDWYYYQDKGYWKSRDGGTCDKPGSHRLSPCGFGYPGLYDTSDGRSDGDRCKCQTPSFVSDHVSQKVLPPSNPSSSISEPVATQESSIRASLMLELPVGLISTDGKFVISC